MSDSKIIKMMIWELEKGYSLLIQSLKGISKEEVQWKPSKNAKTLETIREWNKKGNEWLSTQKLDPISTMEFKIVHLAECKIMYDDHAFREGSLTWSKLCPPEWPECKLYLGDAQARLLESLQALNDNQLEDLVPTNWGERWTIKRIVFTLIHHDAYHLGQLCTQKNLYNLFRKQARH